MKINIAAIRAAFFAAAFLVLSLNSASATNDPIPGIDIIVKKNPGGIAVTTGKTDKTGKFGFSNLKPGKYLVALDVTETKAIGKRQHKPVVARKVLSGVEEVSVSIVFGPEDSTTPNAPTEIEITGTQGKITMAITLAVPPKPTGAK